MKLQIAKTIDNGGYWISINGHSIFNQNIRLGLEDHSKYLSDRIADFQESIRELQALKSEIDNELERRGGKFRPKRVAVPKSDVWFSKCSSCGDTNHNINMVAIEVIVDDVKIFCTKCGKRDFSDLVR